MNTDAYATQISLNKYFIPEGNFSVLLFEPQRVVTPLENDLVKITEYSYQSYFQAFDILYTANYVDWTEMKASQKRKYGITFQGVQEDLNDSVEGLKYIIEKRSGIKITKTHEEDILYKQFPGKSAEFVFQNGNTKYYIKYRVYIINDKEYSLQCIFPSQFKRYSQYENFFNSFDLK
jgi:hypothetical protein